MDETENLFRLLYVFNSIKRLTHSAVHNYKVNGIFSFFVISKQELTKSFISFPSYSVKQTKVFYLSNLEKAFLAVKKYKLAVNYTFHCFC
jgi:hypothetical protein